MYGELAQTIALVTFGTDWLHRGTGEPPDLVQANPVFGATGAVWFAPPTRRWLGVGTRPRMLDGTAAWMADLRRRHARRFSLVIQQRRGPLQPRIAASFAGGGSWAIQVERRDGWELWTSSARFDKRRRAEGRPWQYLFEGQHLSEPLPGESDLDEAESELRRALTAAESLARRGGLPLWADLFAKGLDRLDDPTAIPPPGLFPEPGCGPTAHRLLAAVEAAWVFGGMGSWNDTGPEDESLWRKYDEVTDRLWDAVLRTCAAAANGFSA